MKGTIDSLQLAASLWVAVGLGILGVGWTVIFLGGFLLDRIVSLRLKARFNRTHTIH